MPRYLARRILLGGLIWGVLSAGPRTQAGELSPLAPMPDWSQLEPYQKTISRDEFTRLINHVYSPDQFFWKLAKINDQQVVIYGDIKQRTPLFTLHFAAEESSAAPRPYHFKTAVDAAQTGRPLHGIRIALDPVHIGGDWAKLEARYFESTMIPPLRRRS